MGIIRIKPNGTIYEHVAISGGAASVHAALSDSSDLTYVRKDVTGTKILELDLETPSVPGTDFIVSAVPGLRIKKEKASEKLRAWIIDQRPEGFNRGGVMLDLTSQLVSAAAERALAAAQGDQVAPTGSVGSAAAWENVIANTRLYVETTISSSEALRAYLYEAFVDLYTLKRATVAVSAPSGTITNSSQPTITATVSEVIEAWQDSQPGITDWLKIGNLDVAVYSSAVYGAGGFDPAGSVAQAAWSSFGQIQYGPLSYIDGVTASTQAVNILIGTPLANSTTYRAYVRARRAATGGDSTTQSLWANEGVWSYSQFTISVVPADAPGCTLNASPTSYGAAELTVMTPANPGGHTNPLIEVQRSRDAGTTWETVTFYYDSPVPVTQVPAYGWLQNHFLYDNVAPRGVTGLKYRARVISTLAGYQLATAWTTAAASLTIPIDGWHFKTYHNGPTMMSAKVVGSPEERVNVDKVVFRPKGRKLPVVVRGTVGGKDGSYTIHDDGTGETYDLSGISMWDGWMQLLEYQGSIHVDTATGAAKWIEIVGEPTWTTRGTRTAPLRELVFDYVEVEAP